MAQTFATRKKMDGLSVFTLRNSRQTMDLDKDKILAKFNKLLSRINALEEKNVELETKIKNTDVGQFLERIETLENTVEDLEEENAKLKERIEDLESLVEEKSETITELETGFTNIQTDLDKKLNKTLDNELTIDWYNENNVPYEEDHLETADVVTILERLVSDVKYGSGYIELAGSKIPYLIEEKNKTNSNIVKLESNLNTRTSALNDSIEQLETRVNEVDVSGKLDKMLPPLEDTEFWDNYIVVEEAKKLLNIPDFDAWGNTVGYSPLYNGLDIQKYIISINRIIAPMLKIISNSTTAISNLEYKVFNKMQTDWRNLFVDSF